MVARIADDFAAINARLIEIEQEKAAVRAKQERAEDASFETSPWSYGPIPDVSDVYCC